MKKIIIILIFSLVIVLPLYSANQYLGVKGANFLKIGLSPSAEGMGSSYVSYNKGGIHSLNYNPAGVGRINRTEFLFSTVDWIDEVSVNYFAFATPYEKISGVITSSVSFLYLSPITHYNDWGEDIGRLSFYNIAFSAGYATQLNRYQIGANIKFLYEKIAYKNNTGVALDLGGIYRFRPFAVNLFNKYRLFIRNFNLGMALRNLGSKAGADTLPTSFEFGYSLWLIKQLTFSLTIVKPIYVPESLTDSDYKMNYGLEYNFQKIFFIRTGYKLNYSIPNNYTLGFGVRTKFAQGEILVDYAYAAYTYLEKTNRLSVTFKLKDIIFWKK